MRSKLNIGISACIFMCISGCMVTPNYKQSDQLRSINFKSGVTITPPKDYCLDRKLLVNTKEAGFGMVLPCLDASADVEVGLITVTVVVNDPKTETQKNWISSRGNQKNLLRDQRFGAVKHGPLEQIVGMQEDGWQLVESNKRYTNILTLYVPNYEKVTEKTALTRLRGLLKSIKQEPDNTVIIETENGPVMRPRARPFS